MEDIPENSSIRFDILIPYSAMLVLHPEFEKEWWNMGIHTFVTFPASMNPADIEKSLAGITKNNFPDFMQGREELKLMPFKNFHTRKDIRTFLAAPVSSFHLYILLAVAVVILLIACFNFSNLTISRYAERLRETGIRKVIGAGRLQLIFLFLGESVLLAMAGLMIGIILTELLLPGFNMLTGKSLSFRDLNPTVTGTLLVSLGGCVGLMAGVYPAMIFSSFQPIQAIKGEIILRNRRFELRKVLLTLQYIVCFMLMIAVILTQKQIHFMRDHDLGFNPENIMVFETQDSQAPDEDVRVNSLAGQIRNAGITGIRSVSISENVPGYYFQNQFAGKLHSSAATVYSEMVVTSIDENFLETYGMKLVQGRNFNPDSREDKSNAILINERLASDLGLKEAVGQKIIFKHGEGPYEIIGVVKNIHFQPLQFRIEPLVFRYADAAYRKNFISVSIVPGHTGEIKNFVEGNYKKVFPGNSFNYFFVRDKYDEGYQAESKYAGIIRSFSLVSVFLSLLGLYGLTAVSVNQRKKEIGIRKVFGAGLHNILLLFYREQTLWMVPAFIIACPAGWFLMKRWLQNFPYQTTFNWWIFLLSGLALFVTAFLTIYLKAARAAGKNPVNIIRYE